MKKTLIIFATSSVLLSSCATIFMPKKQKVTINTGQSDATVYVDKEEFGKGSIVTDKVKKDGAKQVIIKTPGYKDNYHALVQTHRSIGYWVAQPFNLGWFIYYGFFVDAMMPKNMSFDKVNDMTVSDKLITKKATDKYIDISNIKLDIKNKDKDIKLFYLKHSPDLLKDIEAAEKKKDTKDAKAEAQKLKKKKKKGASLSDEDQKLAYDDTKFSYNVYKTLKTTGFIDTVNKVFADNNNTLVLEGSIKKVNIYRVYSKKYFGAYLKSKIFLTWYIKNTYDEILDSIETKDYSGEFVDSYGYSDGKTNDVFEKMFADAIDISYLNLHKNPKLQKYIKAENNFAISDPSLTLTTPSSSISDKADAALASVIVKTKAGHGSGFAITNDGYIVTNYHVIAGRLNNKIQAITVINSAGEELQATVVRFNKYRDLALLKVNKTFEKAFKCTNVKSFKNLQDVYTIGAPKSVELGQSISSGVISNERKNNNNNLLQLGMSVNGGNSGGPLFDAQGTLHGVIVSKLVGQNTEGVSFAIPGYLIQEYLNINYK